MKLRSLTLSNVKKFAGQTATISNIGDGVTVVSEANEFGKSTFFDALHALFFLKYGAATRDVKALQPRAGGAVRVSAEVELPDGRFTVEKSFLAQKRATVRDGAGTVIALDDEAEAWIANLMGSGLEGPAGLLWVRQGTTALEPAGNAGADKSEKERLLGARRNLLSSVAGEIDMVTGGRRMDRVIEAASAALGRLATATGQPKANGPWKDAEVEAQTHAARHAELDRACTELSRSLAQRREVAQRLTVLDAPGAQEALTLAVEAAQTVHDAAVAYADKVAQAEGQASLKQLELEGAQRQLDALISAEEQRGIALKEHGDAVDAHKLALRDVQVTEQATQSAQNALTDAVNALKTASSAKEAAQQDALRQSLAEKHGRAQALLTQVVEKRTSMEAANAALATMQVTPAALTAIEGAQAVVIRTQAENAAIGVQVELTYTGEGRVKRGGTDVSAGQHSVPERQTFDIPGVGQMTIDPKAASVDTRAVANAEHQLTAALQSVGMVDLPAARKAAAQRKEKADEIELLKNVLATLAPDGVARIQAEVAQASASLEGLLEPIQAPKVDAATLAAVFSAAQQTEQTSRMTYDRSRDARDLARTAAAHAQAKRDAAQVKFDKATSDYGDPDSFAVRKVDAARNHSLAYVAAQDAAAATQALRDDAPDLATAKADLGRAKSTADNARNERAQLQSRNVDLSATIRARAEDGVEEKRDEAEGLMRSAKERAARLAHEAAGLTLLVEALRAKRGAAQEAYFGPIQQELAPLLALLHADAALSFDPTSLLPQGIARGGTDEAMETLSGGTQEQIAILTRLAFARLFARQGKPMPVILDDALVYSDDSRIIAMFTALHRVAHDQQVIVFSCRQMAFAELGGTRPHVEIVDEA